MAIVTTLCLIQIPKFGPSSSIRRPSLQRKEPDCPAITLFSYADCEISEFSRTRTTTSTRRSPQFRLNRRLIIPIRQMIAGKVFVVGYISFLQCSSMFCNTFQTVMEGWREGGTSLQCSVLDDHGGCP